MLLSLQGRAEWWFPVCIFFGRQDETDMVGMRVVTRLAKSQDSEGVRPERERECEILVRLLAA